MRPLFKHGQIRGLSFSPVASLRCGVSYVTIRDGRNGIKANCWLAFVLWRWYCSVSFVLLYLMMMAEVPNTRKLPVS